MAAERYGPPRAG